MAVLQVSLRFVISRCACLVSIGSVPQASRIPPASHVASDELCGFRERCSPDRMSPSCRRLRSKLVALEPHTFVIQTILPSRQHDLAYNVWRLLEAGDIVLFLLSVSDRQQHLCPSW